MQNDIKKYPIYKLTNGKLESITIEDLNEYDHYNYNLHHYIKKQDYERNGQWFKDRSIEQKLILLSVKCHEQVHFQAVKNLADDDFMLCYGISRWELIFNRKHSKY